VSLKFFNRGLWARTAEVESKPKFEFVNLDATFRCLEVGSAVNGGRKVDANRRKASPEAGLQGSKSRPDSTAKMFRNETLSHKLLSVNGQKRADTWMCFPWGPASWSSSNQGRFESRSVSSRKQKQEVGSPGRAISFGLICSRMGRMPVVLQLPAPFFFTLRSSLFVSLLTFSVAMLTPLRQVTARNLERVGATAPQAASAVEESAPRDPRVMEAARMYENYFLNQMVRAMRSTVSFSDMTKPSMAEGIFREKLDDEYVQQWSQRGGVGLADLIHDELMAKVQGQRAARAQKRKPQLRQISDRDVLQIRPLQARQGRERDTVLVALGPSTTPGQGAQRVTSDRVLTPWAGVVRSIQQNEDQVRVELDQADTPGRVVSFSFDGQVQPELKVGERLPDGGVLGQLGARAKGILIRARFDEGGGPKRGPQSQPAPSVSSSVNSSGAASAAATGVTELSPIQSSGNSTEVEDQIVKPLE